MPATTDFIDQVEALEAKALSFLTENEEIVVDYVAKAAAAAADLLPSDRPEVVDHGIVALTRQVDFAKKVLDSQVRFAKAVLDAAVKPVRPVAKPKAAPKAA